ncbi:MAG TPA: tRNA epoxyqueuosine(34) reductase QueG [Planctomycetes bacterium]|nr:tRNA epoxyqueuosine(34) reductase QueG [Planctomycetota bacterium]
MSPMLDRASWEEALAEAGLPAGGAAPPALPPGHVRAFRAWIRRGFHAGMDWMAKTGEVRLDPLSFAPGARSVLVAGLPSSARPHSLSGGGRVARYALGRDYHKVMKKALVRLERVLARMAGRAALQGRKAVDLHPVAERALARQAGLGWIGRQGQLIHPAFGPWLLLGEIFLPLELEPAPLLPNRCGSCRACLEACPTGALSEPGVVDAGRCVSYWTIEARGLPPRELRPLFGDWFFGCDACLEVCPWGTSPQPWEEPPLHPALTDLALEDYLALRPEVFEEKVRGTPLRRAGPAGLTRNAALVAANLGRKDLAPLLEDLLSKEEPVLRSAGAWALGRLGERRKALEKARTREEDPEVQKEIEAALEGA